MKKRITFNSPVILAFVFISFGAMVANYLTLGASNKLLFVTYHSSLANPLTYVRFFTHVLGHAGWSHYIGNMMYILLHDAFKSSISWLMKSTEPPFSCIRSFTRPTTLA